MPTSRLGTTSRLDIFILSSIRLFQSSRSMVLPVQNDSKTFNLFFCKRTNHTILDCKTNFLRTSGVCWLNMQFSLIKQSFLPRGSQLLSCKPVLNVLLGTKFNQSLLRKREKHQLGVLRAGGGGVNTEGFVMSGPLLEKQVLDHLDHYILEYNIYQKPCGIQITSVSSANENIFHVQEKLCK